MELCCAREFDNASCSDGIDNDGNGFVDCADFGCRNGRYVTACVENTATLCADGRDNDGDGRVDCQDSDCRVRGACGVPTESQPETTLARCMDGIDNDGNTFVDCADFSCTRADRGASPEAMMMCAQRAENTAARCRDGIDNDGDGFTDCDDWDCAYNPAVLAAGRCQGPRVCRGRPAGSGYTGVR
jgi:hypothetical protein